MLIGGGTGKLIRTRLPAVAPRRKSGSPLMARRARRDIEREWDHAFARWSHADRTAALNPPETLHRALPDKTEQTKPGASPARHERGRAMTSAESKAVPGARPLGAVKTCPARSSQAPASRSKSSSANPMELWGNVISQKPVATY